MNVIHITFSVFACENMVTHRSVLKIHFINIHASYCSFKLNICPEG